MPDIGHRDTPRQGKKLLLAKVCVGVLVLGYVVVGVKMFNQANSLDTTWRDGSLHLHSARDGPFIVTHLYSMGTHESAVAELLHPIAIIDSRGEYLSMNSISNMTWIGASGGTNNPPSYGDPIKALYYVPLRTKDMPLSVK